MNQAPKISKSTSKKVDSNKQNYQKNKQRVDKMDRDLKKHIIMLRSLFVLLEIKVRGQSKQPLAWKMKCAKFVRNLKVLMEGLEQTQQKMKIKRWLIRYFKQANPQNAFENKNFSELFPRLVQVIRKFRKSCRSENLEQQKKWLKKFIRQYQLLKDFSKEKRLILKQGGLKCPINSCKIQLTQLKCNKCNYLMSQCTNCGWTIHNCKQNKYFQNKSKYSSYFNIITTGSTLKSYELTRLPPISTKNNIKKIIKKLQYQYTTEQKIIPGTPLEIYCGYPLLSKQAVKQIYRNRQQQVYLPLNIKQSSIPGAGLGVFATQNIDEDVLVCSYIGQIGIGSKTRIIRKYEDKQQTNNSIFTLGFFENEIMIIAPNFYSNVGRFINYNKKDLCNLQASICLLKKQEQKYQIAVILISSRDIKAGEQLFYNYGESYPTLQNDQFQSEQFFDSQQ